MDSLVLPYPAKALWPNGRPHRGAKARETRKHRQWSYAATLACSTKLQSVKRLHITLHPKPSGPVPDADNIVASCKAYADGIADALGLNDRDWQAPTVTIGERRPFGAMVIAVEPVEG